MQTTITEKLKACPFCGYEPILHLGKKENSPLHGEPFQGIVIRCNNHDCAAKPVVQGGDIYVADGLAVKTRALQEASKLWNKREEYKT